MILTIVLTGLALILTQMFCVFRVLRRLESKQRAFTDALKAYFEAPAPDMPSEFGKLLDITITQLSQKLVATLKSSFMGMQSVDSKMERNLEADFAQDAFSQQSPILSAILSSFPSVAKRLRKNPAALPIVAGIADKLNLGKIFAGAGGGNGQHSPSGSPYNPNKYGGG